MYADDFAWAPEREGTIILLPGVMVGTLQCYDL